MIAALLRGLIGFIVACLVAGLVQAGFATAPEVLDPSRPELRELAEVALGRTLVAAQLLALFAAPFVMVAAPILEWSKLRSVRAYMGLGLGIAVVGLVELYISEAADQPTIANWYAVTTLACSGLAGGFVYGLLAGKAAAPTQIQSVATPLPAASTLAPAQAQAGQQASGRTPSGRAEPAKPSVPPAASVSASRSAKTS